MARPVRKAIAPARRKSVIPAKQNEINLPWNLTAAKVKKLPKKSLTKALEIIKNVYQDYQKLIPDFEAARQKIEDLLTQNETSGVYLGPLIAHIAQLDGCEASSLGALTCVTISTA